MGCFYALLVIWVAIIIMAILGIYKLFKMKKNDNDTLRIFKVLYILINLLFVISPPGYAFGIYFIMEMLV